MIALKKLRGTAVYCGIGASIEAIEEHLAQAAKVGINAVFTSLQLPESNKEELLRDFPRMAEIAHRYGMIVDSDVGGRSAKLFGLDLHDFAAFKQLGVDYVRLDYGYTDEQTAEASHNKEGLTIELNASSKVTGEWLAKLISLGIDRERVHFCHNYYPMRYTGLTVEQMVERNSIIHSHGFRVGGFLAAQSHHRMACGLGLPTLERHRNMSVFTAAQEAFLLGLDDLFFGDDFADAKELKTLAEAEPGVVTLRIQPFVEGEIMDWLLGRELDQTQCGLEMILRSNFDHSVYPGDCDQTISFERHRGDVTICKSRLLRYKGEIQLARKDLPLDPDMGLIGRIVDEDLPLLETFRSSNPFRLVRYQPE